MLHFLSWLSCWNHAKHVASPWWHLMGAHALRQTLNTSATGPSDPGGLSDSTGQATGPALGRYESACPSGTACALSVMWV